MLRNKSRLTLAVVLVAATMLVAGGVAVASNTGFKINMPLSIAGAGQVGNNWVSIPYFHPYTNGNVLCTQLGLKSNLVTGGPATLVKIDPVLGTTITANCGAASGFTWAPGQGIRIRNTTGTPVAPTSAIIVGSHNPALSLTIPDAGTGNIGSFWLAVPYHTTAVTVADLCNSVGLTSTGAITAPKASVGLLNPVLGAFSTINCGSTTATTTTLTLGQAVRLREPNGPLSFVPAHF